MKHYTHSAFFFFFFFFFDGYCSTVQVGFTELSFIQIDLCVLWFKTKAPRRRERKTNMFITRPDSLAASFAYRGSRGRQYGGPRATNFRTDASYQGDSVGRAGGDGGGDGRHMDAACHKYECVTSHT